jgi:hypothetical protein
VLLTCDRVVIYECESLWEGVCGFGEDGDDVEEK